MSSSRRSRRRSVRLVTYRPTSFCGKSRRRMKRHGIEEDRHPFICRGRIVYIAVDQPLGADAMQKSGLKHGLRNLRCVQLCDIASWSLRRTNSNQHLLRHKLSCALREHPRSVIPVLQEASLRHVDFLRHSRRPLPSLGSPKQGKSMLTRGDGMKSTSCAIGP